MEREGSRRRDTSRKPRARNETAADQKPGSLLRKPAFTARNGSRGCKPGCPGIPEQGRPKVPPDTTRRPQTRCQKATRSPPTLSAPVLANTAAVTVGTSSWKKVANPKASSPAGPATPARSAAAPWKMSGVMWLCFRWRDSLRCATVDGATPKWAAAPAHHSGHDRDDGIVMDPVGDGVHELASPRWTASR